MATVYYKGLTGVRDSVTGITLATTTIDQLLTAIAADEGLPADYYKISLDGNPTVNDIVYGDSSTKLDTIGFTDGCTVICTTKQVGSKEERQIQKLEIAQLKRSGSAGDGSSVDIPGYRILNTYNRDLLPTKYVGNESVDNANTGGLYPGRPWITETSNPISYGAGLYRTFYNTGWWGIDPTWFNGKTAQNSGANSGFAISLTSGQTLWSYMWIGYFKPNTTATWTFTASGIDDSSAVWIGDNAVSAYTWDNADGKANSATIGSSFSFTKTVTADTYYPMRVMYGNNTGPGNMALYWNSGSGANASWTGKLFYNTATNGF